jgi:hypothetical protein
LSILKNGSGSRTRDACVSSSRRGRRRVRFEGLDDDDDDDGGDDEKQAHEMGKAPVPGSWRDV